MRPRKKFFRGLSLFWKLLLPFLTLLVILGVLGTFLIVRDLSTRTQASLDQNLERQSIDARSIAHDRELYLLESSNFAANIQGMAAAIQARDPDAVARLLRSVLALKTDLTLLAAADRNGKGIVVYRASATSARPARVAGGPFADNAFVREALADSTGNKHAGFLTDGATTTVAIAAPICSNPSDCVPVGVAIVGVGIDRIALEATGRISAGAAPTSGAAAVEIYDTSGRLVAASGLHGVRIQVPANRLPDPNGTLVRRNETVNGMRISTLYADFELQGRRVGTLAVSLPADAAFASVRGTALRLTLILLAAMAGVVGVGALLSRFILRQVHPLVETNRALGRGELTARAPVVFDDELGELARGVNQMAQQLEASHETLELRVAQRTEEVRRLLAERTEFFAAMSHDFRTPLAVMMRQGELLADPEYARQVDAVVETGRAVRDSGKQLLALVNDVLELARAEAGRLELEFESVALADVVGDLRATIEGLARGAELAVAIDVPRDLPNVRADVARLREVILNLVDNAVKYTPAEGHVRVEVRARNQSVEISVSDTGIGIPPEVGDRIFEPFFRVKGAATIRGQASTGLGLALTKRLVEAHGGEISFTSKPGEGTTFRVALTRADVPTGRGSGRRRNAPSRRPKPVALSR
jgi:signal transduction histidine kinase